MIDVLSTKFQGERERERRETVLNQTSTESNISTSIFPFERGGICSGEMNRCVPDWVMEETTKSFPGFVQPTKSERFPGHQNRGMGQDQELVELQWRNGQVVLQAQNHKKQLGGCNESKSNIRVEQPAKNERTSLEKNEIGWTHQSLAQGDETAPWLHCPLDDPFDELCSNFFDEIPATVEAAVARTSNEVPEREKTVKQCVSDSVTKVQECKAGNLPKNNMGGSKFVCSLSSQSSLVGDSVGNQAAPVMVPPKEQVTTDRKSSTLHQDTAKKVNFSHFSRPALISMANVNSTSENLAYKSKNPVVKYIGEPSSSAIGSNNYVIPQNQMQLNPALVTNKPTENALPVESSTPGVLLPTGEKGQGAGDVLEGTSSSGASGSTAGKFGKQNASRNDQKRKSRDVEESDCHSEGIEYESVEAKRLSSKSLSSRRSRAAEVHNLSERRRRDRINEKMKALQELIPHCNKSDKASMLDEAIEYLKSLQLQVQIMWMGGGMAPYMFPGIQHYLSPLAMAHASLPPLHGSMPLPEIPLVDQSRTTLHGSNQFPQCSSSANPMQFPDMNFQEYYACQLSLQQMHMASQMMQQNQRILKAPGSTSVIRDTGVRCENPQFCKSD